MSALPSALPMLAAATLFLLAGCTLPDDAASGTTESKGGGVVVSPDTYHITLTKFAGHSSPQLTQAEEFTWPSVHNGTEFRFTETIEGSAVIQTDHIGGHFGMTSAPVPAVTAYSEACIHAQGKLPGTVEVTCRAPITPGTYHLRGHARSGTEGSFVHWWSDEFHFHVV